MIFLRLYLEFFRTGLFAVGGGLATIPFLRDMGARTGWFTDQMLTTMIAVSESTPGPIGVNMATYVGTTCAGFPGAVAATLGLLTPSICIILLIAGCLTRFQKSETVKNIFYGLRPASAALIAAAGLGVAGKVLTRTAAEGTALVHWPAAALMAAVFVCVRWTPLKKLHPVLFIGICAVLGLVLKL